MYAALPLLSTTGLLLGHVGSLIKSIDLSNHPPEDQNAAAAKKNDDVQPASFDEKRRWGRIAANQIETMPLALMILWGSWNVTNSSLLSSVLFVVYAAARFWFVYAYLTAHSKRGLGFLVGHLVVLASTLSALAIGDDGSTVPMVSSLVLYIINFVALMKSIDPANHPEEDKLAEKPELFINMQRKNMELFRRWTRVAVNQQEQLPMALLVLWAAKYSGADVSVPFAAYAGFRSVYLLGYIWASNLRALGFIGSQLSMLGAMALGGFSLPMLATSALYMVNMAVLIKTADPNNQPKENMLVTEEQKAQHKAKLESIGFDRWTRICVNQLEQFPMALVTLWGALQVAHGSSFITGAFAVYAVARVAFAFFYLQAVRSARQLAFGLSLLTVLSSAVVGALSAFSSPA